MRSKMLLVFVILYFLSGALFISVGATNDEATVYGKVVESQTNDPIPNATVMLWDYTLVKRVAVLETDIEGAYSVSISPPILAGGHSYVIYVYHNVSQYLFDYMPAKTDYFRLQGGQMYERNFSLIPAATIYLEGDIYYVEGVRPSPSFFETLTNPETQKPYNYSINSYGDTTDNWFLRFDHRLAIVPADIPVDLEVTARVPIAKLRGFYRRIQFLVDNEGQHFALSRGEMKRVRLEKYALKVSLDFVDERISDVLEDLEHAQQIGFYVTAERERLLEGKSLTASAKEQIRQGEYLSGFYVLRETIVIVEEVIKTLESMRHTAFSGSVLLLPFFACYAVAGAFFLFEKQKQKLPCSFAIYALEITGFYYIYPGVRLMAFSSFMLSAAAFFAMVLFLVFGFPYIVKERSIIGRARLRVVIAQIFSIGKRNLKRRKLRTTLTIISISVLVLSFTAFTSIGRVYGVVTEKVNVTPLYEGGLIMDQLPEENQTTWTFLPLSFSDVEWLQSQPSVNLTAPKAINLPQEDPIGSLSATNGREQTVYGVVGVSPSVEKNFTYIDKLIVEGRYFEEQEKDSIIITSEAARRLGVDVGDELTFYLFERGYKEAYKNYTLVGIMNGSLLSDVQEINGDPFLPQREIIEDETVRVVLINSSDAVLLPLMAALDIPSVSISRIAFTFEERSTAVQIDELARKIIYVFEYSVWISQGQDIAWWHLGYYLEVRGGEILVLFFIVMLQVATVMYGVVEERKEEVKTLSAFGLNPTHIGSIFLAESVVAGIVGGGLGYILGMSFYQGMSLFNVDIIVRQKLEWYWSAAGLAVALLASVISAIRPAINAAMSTVPSLVRKVKYENEREKWEREKEIFKSFIPEKISLPHRIKENDIAIYNLFMLDRLDELKTGVYERVNSLEDVPEEETVRGELIKRIRFTYYFGGNSAQAELIMTKLRQKDFYSVHLRLVPQPGVPEAFLSHIKSVVNNFCIEWKKRIK